MPPSHRSAWFRVGTVVWMLLAAVICIAVIGITSFFTTPIPGSMLIRSAFDEGGRQGNAALAQYTPDGITRQADIAYTDRHRADERLDVYRRTDATTPHTTIIWVHGGGWVGGDKDQGENYSRILAGSGATVVQLNYTLAPEAQYPTAIRQINEATEYLMQHADELGIATDRLFFAGDSAGSQLVATYLSAIARHDVAAQIGLDPAVRIDQVRGTLLFCGAYDVSSVEATGPYASFLNTVLWAYSGLRDWQHAELLRRDSPIDTATSTFPAAFISAGNGDPLEPQSRAFAQRLIDLGVPVQTRFYSSSHQPALPHEYQVHFTDYPDAIGATRQALLFVADQGSAPTGNDVDPDRVPVLARAAADLEPAVTTN